MIEKTMLMAGLLAVLGLTGPAAAAPLGAKSDPETLPGSIAAQGRFVAEAWLIAPTTRYKHFVHANAAEAGGIRARLADGSVVTLMLPDTLVFEDSIVRLADLDGDGREELVQVLSALDQGAALAVFDVTGEGIALMARTPFIGTAHRWLNPAAIADFDGDGAPEIALVQMPHLEKRLELWALDGDTLRREAAVEDVSNHLYGSPQQPLAVAADFDHDGVADLAIPDGGRRSLWLLRFRGGAKAIDRLRLPGAAIGDLRRAPDGTAFSVRLEAGQRVTVPLPDR